MGVILTEQEIRNIRTMINIICESWHKDIDYTMCEQDVESLLRILREPEIYLSNIIRLQRVKEYIKNKDDESLRA